MKDVTTSTTNCDERILLDILKASKIGIAKLELIDRLPSISHAQLRRCFAELVDKELLHYDELQHIYMTTDRGIIFIRNMEKSHNNSS
jgi:predicted transcriptional regulator